MFNNKTIFQQENITKNSVKIPPIGKVDNAYQLFAYLQEWLDCNCKILLYIIKYRKVRAVLYIDFVTILRGALMHCITKLATSENIEHRAGKGLAREKKMLFKVTSTALPWDFCFFKLTQPLTVSTGHCKW
jgi:hypothetical protein